LRALELPADLDLLHDWMHQPHVTPFWQLAVERESLAAYLADKVASAHETPLIGSLDGRPMSYWEAYWAAHDPLARHYEAAPYDQGIHLLLGPPAYTGRGLGLPLLQAVLRWQLAREPRTQRVVAEPDVRNARMIHVFIRAGFRHQGEIELPDKRAALMIYQRPGPARSIT
ncbi:MAG TPA: GNAT family N-acetyltransferase, partial [Chloroflexota bacterium]|nr:GNAT family N-acetyltransferase [Chloroflexota bacterium]